MNARVLDQLTARAVRDFADCSGLAWTSADPSTSTGHRLAAVLGYSGPALSGALVAMASTEDVDRVAEAMGLRAGDPHAWLGEMANQVLGLLKRSLLRQEVELWLSTPVTLNGWQLNVSGRAQVTSAGHLDGHPFEVVLEYRAAPGLVLSADLAPESPETDVMFF